MECRIIYKQSFKDGGGQCGKEWALGFSFLDKSGAIFLLSTRQDLWERRLGPGEAVTVQWGAPEGLVVENGSKGGC